MTPADGRLERALGRNDIYAYEVLCRLRKDDEESSANSWNVINPSLTFIEAASVRQTFREFEFGWNSVACRKPTPPLWHLM